ncbi:DNA-binding transcriptional ArsR family regulator [Bifidobacterium psychraerophilum DSM 22366]|uniref:ArsR family transcriptional regulator n=2 Tax=Bifidobacterium psychraerophilum TaxID=218140 RepID=A0A087CEG6_9BIFI|nr:ArsR family transcriptional regulator [Bifidobacterium psychraerophilum]PKA93919.1 DNA-binding transcriptional ArsR family regulator [Bifidobacterium psychraerophilum DSM 22366]
MLRLWGAVRPESWRACPGITLDKGRHASYYIHMFEDTHIYDYGAENAYVELAANVFSLLSDPTRLRIILTLKEGEQPVGMIAEKLGRKPTIISQHLAKMRWGKLVRTRQEGTRIFYSLSDEHVSALVDQAIFQSEHIVDAEPAHHATVPKGQGQEGPGRTTRYDEELLQEERVRHD